MKSYESEHELMRRKVWSDAFCAVSNANDCKSAVVAIRWADRALKAFDETFDPLKDEQ